MPQIETQRKKKKKKAEEKVREDYKDKKENW